MEKLPAKIATVFPSKVRGGESSPAAEKLTANPNTSTPPKKFKYICWEVEKSVAPGAHIFTYFWVYNFLVWALWIFAGK